MKREYVVLIPTTSHSIPKETELGQIQTVGGRAKEDKGSWFLDEAIELLDQPLPRPFYLWNSSYVDQ